MASQISDGTGGAEWAGEVSAVPADVRARMRGVSWRPDARCPPFEALRLLTLRHWDFTGGIRSGQLVVAAELAEEVLSIFQGLFRLRFPMERMELVDVFGGDDDASMAANNCSAFNFRNVAGTEHLSKHALGRAIDINPRLNPMIIGESIHPPAGAAYLDRSVVRPGMIVRPGPVVELFESRGWKWGGDWKMRDYHHFVKEEGAPVGTPSSE